MGGSMEIDLPDESNESTTGTKENGFHLYPVSENDSGEGFTYAPEDWPNPGDKWGWKVGKRVAASGTFLDRYLYLPSRLHKNHKTGAFASKLSVQRFIMAAFPGADVDTFFASFSWKIPSRNFKGDKDRLTLFTVPVSEHSGCDLQSATAVCKAGNRMCISLLEGRDPPPSAFMACDICCDEPAFCRDCCCILCCRTVDSSYGGYSFIRCEATADEGLICGHIGHIECGIRCYLAGTVGGSIGLDAEYFCRRCDARLDLVPHATNLFQACESIGSGHEIETILNICVRILCGSSKISAKKLLHHVELAMTKPKNGTSHEEIWKTEDVSAITTGEFSQHATVTVDVSNLDEPLHCETVSPQILSGNFDYRIESLKLEDEVDQVLLELKRSQESEYRIAEETLNDQKNHLLDLYEQLDKERCELAKLSPSADPDALVDMVLRRIEQVKREVIKLRDMKAVAKGFGKTSKSILKEHFGIEFKG